MKPAAFAYAAPATEDGALTLLAEHGDAARVLAGGQSLAPLLNLRLARPGLLVDVNRIPSLGGITRHADGGLEIGATTRQRAAETSPALAAGWPVVVEAIRHIGHRSIRNRGTVGGSVAHADPAAELPAVLTALAATFTIAGAGGRRTMAAAEFFLGPFTTALRSGELLVSVHLPPPPAAAGQAWEEFSRRHGDFGLAGVAAVVVRDGDGRCRDASLVYSGVDWTPWRAERAEALLRGERPTPGLAAAAAAAAAADCDPPSDVHGTGAYRARLVETLTRRALLRCGADADQDRETP